MKTKFFFASIALIAASITSFAQGYKDGIEYYKIGQFDNAKELLERNLNAASTDKAEAFYYLGQVALHQGNTAAAKSFFDKGVTANPNNPLNYVGQGALAVKAGADGKAFFDQARKLAKKDCALEMQIARAMYDANPVKYAKDITKCINNARKWNAKDPASYIFEGDTYADKQEWGAAAGQYELAFTNDDDNVEAYVKYANTYFNVNPDMAIARLEELNTKKPNIALVQRQLAEKYYSDNQGVKAAEKYGEYIQNPNHFTQDEVRFVQLLFFGQKYNESLNLAKSIVNAATSSQTDKFYMRRMMLYNLLQLEDYVQAVEVGKQFFDMALPAGSTYEVRDYTDYAQALQKINMAEEAVAAYEKAIELNPKNLDLLRGLSDSYAAGNDFAKAAYYYQKVIDSNEYVANDLFEAGVAYYNHAVTAEDPAVKADALNKARNFLVQVNEKVPGNVRIVNQMAAIEKVAEGEKITGKATPIYKQLIALLDAKEDKSGYESFYRRAYNYLANVAFNNGDKETAKEYYKKWLEYDPDNEALRKYVESLK